MQDDTSIRIKVKTWQRLNDLKQGPGDSFDEVINRLLDEHHAGDEEALDEGNRRAPATLAGE
jgi:predicted CopG family antitoxin